MAVASEAVWCTMRAACGVHSECRFHALVAYLFLSDSALVKLLNKVKLEFE